MSPKFITFDESADEILFPVWKHVTGYIILFPMWKKFTLHSEMICSLSVAPKISIGEELWPPLSTVDLGSTNVDSFYIVSHG